VCSRCVCVFITDSCVHKIKRNIFFKNLLKRNSAGCRQLELPVQTGISAIPEAGWRLGSASGVSGGGSDMPSTFDVLFNGPRGAPPLGWYLQ
jgi:hypothetical protein